MPFLTTDADIASLLRRSRTIAVVGLSANPARDSNRVAHYLLSRGYTIIPVNPTLDEVLGQKAFPDLASIGHPVDIVDVFRRPEFAGAIADAAAASGARALWLQFDTVDEEAAARASGAGLDVVADRCIMADHRRLLS
ncbi:MAG TPA: CoA-binding protein [Bacteroidota bacterium]|nr:CoA-binding protein [Bacteroidota bacterium]